jgi:hypothetical protein
MHYAEQVSTPHQMNREQQQPSGPPLTPCKCRIVFVRNFTVLKTFIPFALSCFLKGSYGAPFQLDHRYKGSRLWNRLGFRYIVYTVASKKASALPRWVLSVAFYDCHPTNTAIGKKSRSARRKAPAESWTWWWNALF